MQTARYVIRDLYRMDQQKSCFRASVHGVSQAGDVRTTFSCTTASLSIKPPTRTAEAYLVHNLSSSIVPFSVADLAGTIRCVL